MFGNLKNKGLPRFTLRGKDKVDGQWHLFCLVHDIEKIARYGNLNKKVHWEGGARSLARAIQAPSRARNPRSAEKTPIKKIGEGKFSPKNYLFLQAQRSLSAAASAQRAEEFASRRSALATVCWKAWFCIVVRLGRFTQRKVMGWNVSRASPPILLQFDWSF